MAQRVPVVEPAEEEPVTFEAPGLGLMPGYAVGWCWHRVAKSEWRAGFRVCEHGCDPPDAYIARAGSAYAQAAGLAGGEAIAAREFADRFVREHWEVCRHYRPEAIGEGLWTTVRSDQRTGFWVSLSAGRHRDAWDHTRGSHRDDGAYLALALTDSSSRPAAVAR